MKKLLTLVAIFTLLMTSNIADAKLKPNKIKKDLCFHIDAKITTVETGYYDTLTGEFEYEPEVTVSYKWYFYSCPIGITGGMFF